MKIGIFRGSFDPPHFGHILGAVYAVKAFELDSLLICPVYNHPFGKKLSSWDQRVAMLRLAFNGIQICKIDTTDETNKSGHCIDLLRNIKQSLPRASLIMLGGSDTDENKGKYKDEDEILKLCTVARMPRSGYSKDPYAIPNYSSTEIKKLVKKAKWEELAKMMPASIIKYVQTNKLYLKEIPVVSKSA